MLVRKRRNRSLWSSDFECRLLLRLVPRRLAADRGVERRRSNSRSGRRNGLRSVSQRSHNVLEGCRTPEGLESRGDIGDEPGRRHMLQLGDGHAVRRREALGARLSSAISRRHSSVTVAYLYEIQARTCRGPRGRSEFGDVPRRIYVEAPDLTTCNAVGEISEGGTPCLAHHGCAARASQTGRGVPPQSKKVTPRAPSFRDSSMLAAISGAVGAPRSLSAL